ncbi:ABC transporter substrate-binding protein [Geminicoccus roseus]|uniref:ABC transporter substrate-binding protein n=1 Tax=Geminicoccus roseus TaxID=404900 RepID=UPI000417680E|nr:spermidine/putrescine ABC transporter substrate-binding protein [Geminicoccus roseus]
MARRPSPFPMPYLSRRHLLGTTLSLASIAPFGRVAQAAEEAQVNVYNWDTYIGTDTLAEFTEATGIDVRYDLFASADELFGKLREGNPGFDVIFPSNNIVERMAAADMLIAVDRTLIPNLENIAPAFANAPYNPGLKWGAPYFWGTQGLGYRQSMFPTKPTSWKDMTENEAMQGRFSLLSGVDTLRMALKALGFSLDTRDPAQIAAAGDYLIRIKPGIKTFAPDTGQDLLLAGEVDICLEWSGDIQQVAAEDDDLAYVIPEEGSMLWSDNMVIPKGAPHPINAHAFINFILTPEVHGAIATEIGYASPNAAAMAFIPEAARNNRAIYPSEETLARCEYATYKGEAVETLYEQAMTRVLAA